ncbi:alkaline-phosphatase-like protein, partial [Dichotomocladium elegans]
MQRVKGLMTGSLPTFIDAGENFASSVVTEDHLLRQIRTRYKELYFMGDDTWTNLFPDVLFEANKTFESDSFKMFDLNTVDDRILSHLWPLVEGTEHTWEVAIAHFLGVDHCGHTYGPSHPNMAIKLQQMNSIIERLIDKTVDDRTLLVVMGDHGMSVEGDHGGESVEELTSALFMHSKRPLTRLDGASQALYFQIHQARADRLGYDPKEVTERLQYNASKYATVSQIHLVPTLAYLLNVPIPFGNLGALIPDVVINSDDEEPIRHMAEQFRRNARQVANYLEEYGRCTNHPGFAPKALESIYTHLAQAEADFAAGSFEHSIFAYDRFLTDTIKYCQAIWAQFDVGSMAMGILLLTATTCAAAYISFIRQPAIIWRRAVLLTIGTTVTCLVGAMAALVDGVRGHGWFEKMTTVDAVGAVAVLAGCVVLIGATQGKTILDHDWSVILTGTLINAFTLASNSFVIWEDRGTRFIAATLCAWWFARSFRAAPILIMAWIRLTGLMGQCREEQFPYCSYLHSGYLTKEKSVAILSFFILNLVLLVHLIRLF